MNTENDKATFSTRLPKKLADQIDQRARLNRRNRNAEIVLLLEMAIDLAVTRDKKILDSMKQDPTVLQALPG
jgi:hypothetical protein